VNILFAKIRDKHALWYKGIVFIFCVVTCAYLLPKNNSSQTNFLKKGDVWLDDDLHSTIDFLVKKTDAELLNEKNDYKARVSYYKKTSGNSVELLSGLKDLSHEKSVAIKLALDSIYDVGVYHNRNTLSDSLLYIVRNNEAVLVNTRNLFDKDKIIKVLSQKNIDEKIINQLSSQIKNNIIYDENLTKEMVNTDVEASYIYKSKVETGDLILHKNDIVTDELIQILKSYRQAIKEHEADSTQFPVIIGQFLACALVLGIMMLFLAFFRKAIFSQNTQVTFIFLIILVVILATSFVAKYNIQYIYAIPFCLVPILIRIFFDSRTSLFNFLNIILICALFTNDKFEFVFIQLIAGIGTIFSVADMGKRSKLFISALLTFIFYVLAFISYHLINNTAIAISQLHNYIPFMISSVCVLFSFPLIYLFEKLFGFVSDFTLLELCDLNSPLLRLLSQKIPGTFQHSLQVANLAEEACYKIGGNALLVRTGAMYHDIGKMSNARFFTENQVGEISPHEDLSSEESAQIIIGHVIKGVEIAKQYNLPETVIDFIRTHHGTTTTRYFLHNYIKEHEGEVINEDLFRYPGPIPFSKETAILMMADGVEASSRSLKKYDAITIDELVDRIINHQINENQFMNADITFKDINQIKKIFKKRLMNIYHVRIEYPR
jgi:putative nucleotidyltransferase with HDIG domain